VPAVMETRYGLALLDDRRDELPHQVISENGCRGTLARVAWAAGGLEKLGGNRNRRQILACLAQQDRVGLVQAVDCRSFGSVDLGPFVTEAVAVIALGQRRALPYAGRSAGKLADQARPVVNVGRRAGSTIDCPFAIGESSDRAADPRDRAQQIDREVDS